MTVFAFTRHTGVRVAEIGFALMALAGVLLAIAPTGRFDRSRAAVAGGVSLAAGAIVVIVAVRWGSFGSYF